MKKEKKIRFIFTAFAMWLETLTTKCLSKKIIAAYMVLWSIKSVKNQYEFEQLTKMKV